MRETRCCTSDAALSTGWQTMRVSGHSRALHGPKRVRVSGNFVSIEAKEGGLLVPFVLDLVLCKQRNFMLSQDEASYVKYCSSIMLDFNGWLGKTRCKMLLSLKWVNTTTNHPSLHTHTQCSPDLQRSPCTQRGQDRDITFVQGCTRLT